MNLVQRLVDARLHLGELVDSATSHLISQLLQESLLAARLHSLEHAGGTLYTPLEDHLVLEGGFALKGLLCPLR